MHPPHRPHPGRAALAALALAALAGVPAGAHAQSIVTGGLEGRVQDAEGRPVPGAIVTLQEPRDGMARIRAVDADGRFVFQFVAPGTYELLAEALGRQPVIVAALRIEAGRLARINLPLEPAQPPVERRDTLRHAGVPEAGGASLSWVDPAIVRSIPDDRPGLTELASLSALTDGGLGIEGLPERFTRQFVDGQPFEPIRVPGAAGDPIGGTLVPRSAVSRVSVLRGTSDIELTGGSGGFLAVSTGVRRVGAPETFALYSGSATWGSSGFEGDVPSFTSLRGGIGTSLTLIPDTVRLHFVLEANRSSTPAWPVVGDSVAALLFPAEGGETGEGEEPLTLPQLRELTSLGGSANLDWSLGDRGNIQARIGGTLFQVEQGSLPDAEPVYPYDRARQEGVDGGASANLIVEMTERLALEIRAGASLSRRDHLAGDEGAPATFLLDPAVALGTDPSLGGEIRRTDVGATAGVHLTTGVHRLKGGVQLSRSAFAYDAAPGRWGSFLFGDAAGVRGEGLFTGLEGAAPPTSFGVSEVGGFVQYRWTPVPNLVLTLGGRYDLEVLPLDEVRPDTRFAGYSGLLNAEFERDLVQVGARFHGSWDLTGDNRTVLEGGVSVDHGDVDPGALHEVIQNSGLVDVTRTTGALPGWPGAPAGAGTSAAGLSLFGPELVPPRTTRAQLGFAQRVGRGATLRVLGSARTTEFMLRRSDLNLPVVAAGSTPDGRPVWADLVQVGGVIVPEGSAWRRFPEYDAVWALDADGWSEYRGVTVGFEQAIGATGAVFANYTMSETTDNLYALRRTRRGAALDPGIGTGEDSWVEGTSDLDIPHRLAAGVVLPVRGSFPATLTAVYQLRSGLPFTPMVREGLDANGDGSWVNDPALVPDVEEVAELAAEWDCLGLARGRVPERNGCRGPSRSTLDLRLAAGPFDLGGMPLEVLLDVLNVTDQEEGIRDDALLLLDPEGELASDGSGRVTIPWRVNPAFGSLRMRTNPGRLIRVGLRVGVPR